MSLNHQRLKPYFSKTEPYCLVVNKTNFVVETIFLNYFLQCLYDLWFVLITSYLLMKCWANGLGWLFHQAVKLFHLPFPLAMTLLCIKPSIHLIGCCCQAANLAIDKKRNTTVCLLSSHSTHTFATLPGGYFWSDLFCITSNIAACLSSQHERRLHSVSNNAASHHKQSMVNMWKSSSATCWLSVRSVSSPHVTFDNHVLKGIPVQFADKKS